MVYREGRLSAPSGSSVLAGSEAALKRRLKATMMGRVAKPNWKSYQHENPPKDGEVQAAHPAPWVEALVAHEYFGQCPLHLTAARNERNFFCIDCATEPLCSICIHHHKAHRLLQVRKSSYHDAVRCGEAARVGLDLNQIQTYVINSARIVFLNARPHPPRSAKSFLNACVTCERSLHDNFRYCSIACKLAEAFILGGEKVSVLVKPGSKHVQYDDEEDFPADPDYRPAVVPVLKKVAARGHTHAAYQADAVVPSSSPPSPMRENTFYYTNWQRHDGHGHLTDPLSPCDCCKSSWRSDKHARKTEPHRAPDF
eukprot:jgi/Chlat1/6789/Chrsp51S06491